MAIQDELAFELDIEPQVLTPIDENWVLRLMQKGVHCSTAYRLLETVFQIERERTGYL